MTDYTDLVKRLMDVYPSEDNGPLCNFAAVAIEALTAERDAVLAAATEARAQLAYMDERSPSGTTPAIISRIDAVIKGWTP